MTAGRRTQPLLLGLLLAAAVACSAARELHAAAPPLASLPGDAQRMPTSSQPQSAIVGGECGGGSAAEQRLCGVASRMSQLGSMWRAVAAAGPPASWLA